MPVLQRRSKVWALVKAGFARLWLLLAPLVAWLSRLLAPVMRRLAPVATVMRVLAAPLMKLASFIQPVWAPLRRLSRGPTLGGVVVLLFCGGVLVASFRGGDRYYEKHLTAADSSYYLTGPSLLVSGKDDFRLRQVLRNPAPLSSSDGGTAVYVLQTMMAWYLRAFLPLRPSMAVVLNGIWFVGMAGSVYSLLWSRIGKWSTAALGTIAFLVLYPYLTTTTFGLTSMDPNVLGYMLGTSVLCCTMLSDRFTRILPSAFVGLFLGCLTLGRVYTLGVVVPAMLPYVLACFWRRSWSDMLRSVQGGFIALCVAYAVCGWFVLKHWKKLLAYPTQYGSGGVLSQATPVTLTDTLFEWLRFPKLVFAQNIALVCVLSWPLAAGLFSGPERRFRRFNWGALWATLAPLCVLAKMGTTFQPYGAVALFGLFVLLLFPFAKPDAPLPYRGRFAAVLSVACALNCWTFFSELHSAHDSTMNNKRSTVAALQDLRTDALSAGRKRVTLGLVHWGTLHDAALVNALIFDLGVRVATPDFQPKRRPKNPLIVDALALDPWAWDPTVSGAATMTPEVWANRLVEDADYVIVLAGGRNQDRRHGRWPAWIDASEILRASPVFKRLGSPFWVTNDGPLELLVRREPRRR